MFLVPEIFGSPKDQSACGLQFVQDIEMGLELLKTTKLSPKSNRCRNPANVPTIPANVVGCEADQTGKVTPGAKTINVFRACLGAQLTICAQK